MYCIQKQKNVKNIINAKEKFALINKTPGFNLKFKLINMRNKNSSKKLKIN